MSGGVSLVLVTYRSSAVVCDAVASFRRELARVGAEGEVVLVDHSEDADELERLQAVADRIVAESNRGYAAGINAGVAAAGGETVLVGNPDIRFGEGSIAALLAALDSGWDVVGPQFVLGDLLLAPADEQTSAAELWRLTAGRSRAAWRRLLRREVTRWRRIWEAPGPLRVNNLSGALIGARGESLRRVGPWDEGYFLYYEETDWLLRARRAGLRVALVPGSRVSHLWAHAADPGANAHHFAASRARFLARHFGLPGGLVARCQPRQQRLDWLPHLDELDSVDTRWLWLVSPTGDGLHAATPAPGTSSIGDTLAGISELRGRNTAVAVLAWDPVAEAPVGVRHLEV